MGKIAIIAALEREVRGAVRHWKTAEREHADRRYRLFESDNAVLVCAGIGAEPARRAAEAIIAMYQPELVLSIGFAGALTPALKPGMPFKPQRVIDARDGSVVQTPFSGGTLVSFAEVAGAQQKANLAKAYGAEAVDMEAAAVARAARAHGLRFAAYKAIADEYDFNFPQMPRFIAPNGQLRTSRFVLACVPRPWLWAKLGRLGWNSAKASQSLCVWLQDARWAGELKALITEPRQQDTDPERGWRDASCKDYAKR